jgi:transcriptional regulator with XRE-family HTH domain
MKGAVPTASTNNFRGKPRIYPDWMPRETFGQRCLRLRTARSLSLRDVHAVCGVNISTLSRIERDGGDVTLSNVAKIAAGFGITVSELLSNVDLSKLEQPS